MVLKTIIIDDELDAVEAIENIVLLHTNEIEVIAKTCKPFQAVELINIHQPHFIFLDIEMPGMGGFELLDCFSDINFEVIFVTAYDQYAIQAIKKNAIDYVLKPINIIEIINAINKVRNRVLNHNSSKLRYQQLVKDMSKQPFPLINIPTTNGIEFINSDNIIRIEASGSYTYLFLEKGNSEIITKSLKDAEQLFESPLFFRIHRSHIINLKKIKRYETDKGIITMIDNSKVPISRRKKDEFCKLLKMKALD